MPPLDLREPWGDLLKRRAGLAPSLAPYGRLLEAWAAADRDTLPVLDWPALECETQWARGRPLLAGASPPIPGDRLEAWLAPAMAVIADLGPEPAESVRRVAEAWDAGQVTLGVFLPGPGRLGRPGVEETLGLSPAVLGFLAYAALRPVLDAYLGPARLHLGDGVWGRGQCPFCGGPAAWSDVGDDGQRHLACHLCGGGWRFARIACPFCGTESARTLARLQAEGQEEGYSVQACRGCGTYLKELDRRVRWNGGLPLLEDWGSPHLDLIARRAGYRRALPTLLDVAGAA